MCGCLSCAPRWGPGPQSRHVPHPLTRQGSHRPLACLPPVMVCSLSHKVSPSHCWMVWRKRKFLQVLNGNFPPWHCFVLNVGTHLQPLSRFFSPFPPLFHQLACARLAFRMAESLAEGTAEQPPPGRLQGPWPTIRSSETGFMFR